ncbi:MAG: hypothetical protein ACT4PV_12330 [Planctomycetaceae bacterium]
MTHRILRPAALLMLLALGVEASTLRLSSRRYTDESNGFSFSCPEKWDQIPTRFNEVLLVGKWSGKAKKGWYTPEGYVLKFVKRASEPESATSGAPGGPMGIPGYGGALEGQAKDLWEYLEKNFMVKLDVTEEDPELKVSDKTVRAHFKVMREQMGAGGASKSQMRELAQRQLVIVAAQFERRDESDTGYGLFYLCTAADEEDMRPAFELSIKRFRILDPEVEEAGEDGEPPPTDADIFVDSETKPEAWRAIRKKKLIAGWTALDTKNYLLIYNEEVKRALIKAIALQIEAIRAQVYEQLFPPTREVKAISVVRVCKDAAEYHKYGGPGGSAGYWSSGDEELVFYQDKSNKSDSLRVLYHEAFHQYIFYAVGNVAPHSWFNEGHGDYFAGHNYKARKFESDVFRWRTGIIANALSQKSYVPLRDFLKYTQQEYYSNPGLCYAQGWSFVYFLREVERRKIKKYQKYWGLLDKYFAAIKANVKEVQEKGLFGLEDPPQPPPGPPPPEGDQAAPPVEPEKPKSKLPAIPGLDAPFPGEHPEAGVPASPNASGTEGETRTVAEGGFRDTSGALNVAVDQAFRGIDLDQLEKDWIEFSK